MRSSREAEPKQEQVTTSLWARFWGSAATPAAPVSVDEKTISDMLSLAAENSEPAHNDLRSELEKLFSGHLPNDIPAYNRKSIINICLLSGVWPLPDAKELVCKDAAQTKMQLMLAIKAIIEKSDVSLKINALLQSLCKVSFLGGIFHIQRRAWGVPSIDRQGGSLQLIAIELEATLIALGSEKLDVLADTQKALIDENKRNPNFIQSLVAYPNLNHLVNGCVGTVLAQDDVAPPTEMPTSKPRVGV